MNQPIPFELSNEDKKSKLWRKLKEHWESRLETLRTQNDGDKNDIDTAKLRGRIAEIKDSISLGTEKTFN